MVGEGLLCVCVCDPLEPEKLCVPNECRLVVRIAVWVSSSLRQLAEVSVIVVDRS